MIYGTDVAGYQPIQFAREYQGHPVVFSIVKATEAVTFVNPNYVGQVKYARSKGDVVGHYHFLHVGNVYAQLSHFGKTLKSLGTYKPGDVIALDWEHYQKDGKTWIATNAEKDEWLKQAAITFPESRVVLYCNKTVWFNNDRTGEAGDGLWIAAPSDPDGKPGVKAPWVFQQISSANNQDWNVGNFADKQALSRWAYEKVNGGMADRSPAEKSATYRQVWDTDAAKAIEGIGDPANDWWAPMTVLRTAAKEAHEAKVAAEEALKIVKAIAEKVGA